ncbi:hypothetical protein SELMODRAFT_407504 [Selaginella moellendorffii]|uniref:Mitochondrial import inner membrane translocase subunit TIM50 n=1 Tax=Selaginella moellendorffii TaxID=88036 RepID=D8R5U1_SELML|nr:hypothetical protein SELMODRAFT_407504 [Selaginella moellendorffii]
MVVEHLCARNTLLPPQDAVLEGRMTVALALDNTLVSSTSILLHRRSQCDFEVRDNGSRKCIKKRAHLDEFLDALALFAEVVLFSSAPYAARSSRDSLPIRSWDLRKVVLVDDDPGFFCQPGSGNEIVIGKFTGQRSDDELLKLLPVLQSLAQLDDVRPAVRTYQQPQAQEGNKPGSGYIQTLAARDIMTIVACEGLVDTYHIWDARVKRAGFEGVAVTEEIYEKQVKFSQMAMTISSASEPGGPRFCTRRCAPHIHEVKLRLLMSACTTDWNNITGLKLRIFSKKSFRGCR